MSNPELKQDYEASQKLAAKKLEAGRLRALIVEGMESPLSSEPMDAVYFEKLRDRIREKAVSEK